ncbi:MAG: PAS domain S-box protein [Candidatus Omnitrophica bacterium]|nr:PAS domain S-box protein [Candidatus Omnitrophota bacterium]
MQTINKQAPIVNKKFNKTVIQLLIGSLLILLFILITELAVMRKSIDFELHEIHVSNQFAADNISNQMFKITKEADYSAVILANYQPIADLLQSSTAENIIQTNKYLDQINLIMGNAVCYVMDLSGKVIASSNRDSEDSFIGHDYNFRPYFQKAIEQGKGDYFALGITSGKQGYYSACAIKDSQGKVWGVAVAKKELDILVPLLKQHRDAFIVSPEGIIFLSSNKEFVGQSLWPIGKVKAAVILASKQFGDKPIKPLFKHQFKEHEFVVLDKEKLLPHINKIGNNGWFAVVLSPISVLNSQFIMGAVIMFMSIVLWLVFFLGFRHRIKTKELLRKSESNYQAIFDASMDAIFIHDAQTGQILDVNKTMCEMFGVKRAEVTKLSVGNLSSNIAPYTQENAIKYIRQAANGEPQKFEWQSKKKDGQLFWTDISLGLCQIGERQCMLAAVRDITENKKNTALLIEEHKRAQRYLDIVGVIIIVLNADKTVDLINKKGCEILGYEETYIVGKNWFEMFLPEDSKVTEIDVFQQIVRGEIESAEYCESEILTSSGQRRLIAWRNKLLKDNNEIIGILSSGEDIKDKKKYEQDILGASKKYEQLSKELEQGQSATLNILEDLQEAKGTLEISRQNFLNIIEKSTDSVLIVDNQDRVKFANASCGNLFGHSVEQIMGQSVRQLIGIEFKSVGVVETKIKHIDGNYKIAEIKAVNTEWEEKPMTLVLLHDITERKHVEDLLLNAAHEWRVTFDSIGHGLALLDLEGKIVRCNKSLSDFVNKTYAEILGQDCHDLVHGQENDGLCPISQTLKTKQRSSRVIQQGDKWIALSVDPLFNDQNELAGFVHSVIDLTEQKMIEQKLQEYTDYVENIIETAQALIIGFDLNLNIKTINTFAEDLLGQKREDIIGHSWLDLLIPKDYRVEIIQVLSNCLEGDRVKGYEIPVLNKYNKETMVSWDSAELCDADGVITGIVVMGYDVSQRKEIEKVQRLAQLGTLVSHMAHEVNNPLMVISGRAQLSLMEDIENEEVKANLDIVMKECQRAKEIIQRLLRFSRPSRGELRPTDVNASLKELVDLIEHQFGLNNVHITKDYAPDLPLLLVDEKQIHEVFMNLLTNAQDAIGTEGTLSIKTEKEGKFIKITFTDSGEGISNEVMDKIFEPFFTTKQKGTGLGLSICYSIIKAHNGDLRFTSVLGQGTTAVVLVPYLEEDVDV